MWLGVLDVRELPVLCRQQRACNLIGSPEEGYLALPVEDAESARWEPLRLRFAIGSADVFWNAGGANFDGMVALGELSVIPGGKTRLQLGEERLLPLYTVVGVPSSLGAGSPASGQVTSGYQSQNAGLIIDGGIERVVGGVVISGSVESSTFTFSGNKMQKSIQGDLAVRIGKWQPLVVFGSATVGAPSWTLGLQGLTVFVRADYAD
jgi:hypothetical protein